MRRLLSSFLVLVCSIVVVDSAHAAPPAKGTISSVAGSNISGKVTLRPTKDGTRISAQISGLEADVEYIVVWSTTTACDVGTAPPLPTNVIGRVRGDKMGKASVTADVTATVDQIHSVAVQIADGLTLVGCAPF